MAPNSISPQDLKKALESKEPLYLLDVREPIEYQGYHIEGSVLIPLQSLYETPLTLSKDTRIVTICAAGIRSQTAQSILKNQGYQHVLSLQGGLIAYSKIV